jgi:ribosomal protein S18 acetylase RimI-like enzyme
MPIELIVAEDYDEVLALWQACGLASLRPAGRDSREAFAAQLESGAQIVLGLRIEGELAGVVVVTHDGRKGWINRLAVGPAHRGSGHGRALLEAGEQLLHDQGLEVIAALIEEDNTDSVAFFGASGYVRHSDVVYLSKRARPDS